MTDFNVTMHKLLRIPPNPDRLFPGGRYLITVAEKEHSTHNAVIVTDVGAKYAMSVTSCMDAIALYLLGMGIGMPMETESGRFYNFVEHYDDTETYSLAPLGSIEILRGGTIVQEPILSTDWTLLKTEGIDPCEVAPILLEEILEFRLAGELRGEYV